MQLQTIVDDQIFFNKIAWLIISLVIFGSFILTIYLCGCCNKANVRKSKSPFNMIEKKSKSKTTKTNVKIKKSNVKTSTNSSKEKRSKQSDTACKEKSLRISIKSPVSSITKEFDKTQSEKSPKNEVPEAKRIAKSNDKIKTADKSIKIYDRKQTTKRQERPETSGYAIIDEEQRQQVDNEAIKKREIKQFVKQKNFGDTPLLMLPKQKKHNFSHIWKPPDSDKEVDSYRQDYKTLYIIKENPFKRSMKSMKSKKSKK